MTIKLRLLLCAMAVLATMSMVDCNEYSCGGFGSLPCTAGSGGSGSGSFGGGGGGGSTAATAFAFAVDQGGTVDGYTLSSSTFAATANFAAPATTITNNPGAGMVVVQQSGQQPFVYAVFGPPNSTSELFGWSMSTSGALTLLQNLPAPLSFIPDVSIPFNQYNIATNPAGTLLFIADSFEDQIFVFQIATTGALTAVTGSPFPTPSGVNPGNLTTDGLGNYLYVTETLLDHTGAGVLGYSIGNGTNGTTLGVLTELSSSPFAFNMWQLQGDASGSYLVGTSGNSAAPGFGLSNADDDHLYVFSIQQTGTITSTPPSGTLTEVGTGFATTNSPLNIAMQPPSSGGEFVYSFSLNDSGAAYNPVEGYQLITSGAQAGTLTPISGFPTSGIAAGHWGQFDQSGANLLVYSSISNGTTIQTQLGALSIDSSGIPTEPTAPATLVTPGYWVVTDPQ
ncbi:MAG: hypothetical protein WAM78_00460 [Candidatus Sulfotelmatobacter sp.]